MSSTIKLVASDMDGTFLRDNKEFDEPRFKRILHRMTQQGARFVLASGNQYIQLKQSFPGYADTLSYVAENGGYVVDSGELIYTAHLDEKDLRTIYNTVMPDPNLYTIFCGEHASYIEKRHATPEFIGLVKYYFPSLEIVDNLLEINDNILKACEVMQPDDTDSYYQMLRAQLPSHIIPTTSGHGSIDLILTGINKAFGIDLLVKRWNITPEECIAFGDAANDIEMLSYVGCGYAMANAMDGIADYAQKQAPSNNEDGVLEVLEKLFQAHNTRVHLVTRA